MKAGASFYPGDIPPKPGIYIYRDRFGKVIYVGKAKNLRKRMSSYFQASKRKTADPKLRSLINSIDTYEFHVVKTEDESLILESKLIKDYAPKYNVLLRDDKRFQLIKITMQEKWPRVVLTRIKKDDGSLYFGPYPKGGALKSTIEFLNREFGLRICKVVNPGEEDHKHCLSRIVKDCTEPCVNKVTEAEYREQLDHVIDILNGNVKEIVTALKEKMANYAEKHQFEKAAEFRDMIANLEEVYGAKNRSFKFASIPSAPGDVAVDELQKALGMKKRPTVIEGFDNSHLGGEYTVSSMVCFRDGKPSKKDYRRFRIKDVHQIDDYATMQEVIRRHYGRKLRDNLLIPDLILIDGGKGQLHCAIDELEKIGFPPTPIIGLAKRQEEIFIPGRSESIILDKHSPELRLLQAIRDESHRFAISYNRQLRTKKISESILDDIPGIGSKRKIMLIQSFGSVRELRKATAQEISEKVAGIGVNMAQDILSYLKKNK